jgi:hypothetical protein
MRDTDLKTSIRRATWPDPSAELRARVLQDSALVERPLALTDRIWFSRGWRLSLAATSFGVIALGYLSDTSAIVAPHSPGEMARIVAIEETMRDAGLPADEAGMFARRAVDSRSPARSAYASTSLKKFETFEMNGGLR